MMSFKGFVCFFRANLPPGTLKTPPLGSGGAEGALVLLVVQSEI